MSTTTIPDATSAPVTSANLGIVTQPITLASLVARVNGAQGHPAPSVAGSGTDLLSDITVPTGQLTDQQEVIPEGGIKIETTAPPIDWEKSYGFSKDDVAFDIQQTRIDQVSGYIVAGYTTSPMTGKDYWVVKINNTGGIVWQKKYGGLQEDIARSIQPINGGSGGYIIAGSSKSTSCILPTGSQQTLNHGLSDYWVVKIDNAGNIVWQRSYGGSNQDVAYSIQLSGHNCIIAGYSMSKRVYGYGLPIGGQPSGNHGLFDYWVVKINPVNGAIIWQKSYGGSNNDRAHSILLDGQWCIVAGYSESNNGNVNTNYGVSDYWVVKINSVNGAIVWQKSYGGSGVDIAQSIQKASSNGYIVAGYSWSKDHDVTQNHGQSDYWVVRLNSSGSIVWQKSYGGSKADAAYSIRPVYYGGINGFIVAGYTYSNDDDVTQNHGLSDYWVVELNDATGSIVWQESYGGSSLDFAYSILQTPIIYEVDLISGHIITIEDCGYIVAGGSSSNPLGTSPDGDVNGPVNPGPGGMSNYWVVKLDQEIGGGGVTITSITPNGAPNTQNVCVNIIGTGFQPTATVTLNYDSQVILATNVNVVNTTMITCCFDITAQQPGFWNVTVKNSKCGGCGKLIDGFEIQEAGGKIIIASITPSTAPNTGPVKITNLAGTNFPPGAQVSLTREGFAPIGATNVNVVSTTKITCVLPITRMTPGAWNVVVLNPTTGEEGTLANGFTITGSPL
jgi:hypothetical protein